MATVLMKNVTDIITYYVIKNDNYYKTKKYEIKRSN